MARKAAPNRRKSIIDAATRVFAQKGYAAARIIEVAQAASVGKGTIYEYFRSKEELFFAVFEAVMLEAGEDIAAAAKQLEGSFAQRMRKLSDGIIQSWLGQLEMYALVMEFWSATASSPGREEFKAVFQKGYRHLRTVVGTLITDAQGRGEVGAHCDARQIASALVGTWDALLLQAWLDPEFDALATSRAFMEVIVQGLGADPGAARSSSCGARGRC
jgi:AcrR family transcriptional regulator